ncbi:MAG TPA: carbohydrate ABC transporter permease, partial [Candidatus Dormibacteraeota bacterium]|nr:carbohydrate ABC transporter permease [Candidatus Dormibacteraeota bacterium]
MSAVAAPSALRTRPAPRPRRLRPARIALHAFLVAATALWLFPLLWAVYAALRPVSDTLFNGYVSWPRALNLNNFTTFWTEADLPYFYINTMVIV